MLNNNTNIQAQKLLEKKSLIDILGISDMVDEDCVCEISGR
jgi:hypothetical protein